MKEESNVISLSARLRNKSGPHISTYAEPQEMRYLANSIISDMRDLVWFHSKHKHADAALAFMVLLQNWNRSTKKMLINANNGVKK